MAKITEKYQSLKTKYNLPEFSDMNRAYDIEGIDAESSQVLAKIRNQMKEQIESYAKALEGFIQPDSSLGAMYETHFMSDETRKDAFQAFKKLMYLVRDAEIIGMNIDEEKDASYIIEAHNEMKDLFPKVISILTKARNAWKKELGKEEESSYFG